MNKPSQGFDHSDKDDAKYEAVTLEDVKRVAAKILAEDTAQK